MELKRGGCKVFSWRDVRGGQNKRQRNTLSILGFTRAGKQAAALTAGGLAMMLAAGGAKANQQEPQGPLSSVGKTLAQYGVRADINFLDLFDSNPSEGIDPGNTQNTGLLQFGAAIKLDKLAGIRNGTVHFLQTVSFLRSNENFGAQQGDNTVGFQYPRVFRGNELSVLTYEHHLLNDKLEIEFGRSNPMRYFGLPICQDPLTCFNDVYAFDANAIPIIHSSWVGRVKYKFTPAWYLQVGGSEDNHTVVHTNGYTDWNGAGATGELALGEIGYRTTLATTKYPQQYELIGYYNSSSHLDPLYTVQGHSKVQFPHEPGLQEHGTGGIMMTAQKLVWRADGGRGDSLHPFSLMSYGGFGYSPDDTVPVKADIYGGLTLQSPFASRPFDQFGVEAHWSRLTGRQYQYLQQAYAQAGGIGGISPPNKFVFEVNALFQVFPGAFLQPSLQYVVNPNNYYAPTSRQRARDGLVVTASFVWHVGETLGLSTPYF